MVDYAEVELRMEQALQVYQAEKLKEDYGIVRKAAESYGVKRATESVVGQQDVGLRKPSGGKSYQV